MVFKVLGNGISPFFEEIAAGDRRHFRDVADLRCQVRRHEVDVIGEVLQVPATSGTCA
jgi:hypothetical protein